MILNAQVKSYNYLFYKKPIMKKTLYILLMLLFPCMQTNAWWGWAVAKHATGEDVLWMIIFLVTLIVTWALSFYIWSAIAQKLSKVHETQIFIAILIAITLVCIVMWLLITYF